MKYREKLTNAVSTVLMIFLKTFYKLFTKYNQKQKLQLLIKAINEIICVIVV